MNIYDLIIIGGGPAGCAGAVYSARKRLKSAIITSEWGGQSVVSPKIENWIGTPAISGIDFAKNLKDHVMTYAGEFLDIIEGENVEKIEKDGEKFKVTTFSGKTFETKAVLITTGSGRRKLNIKGAEEYENKGITYCATCDAPLFDGQDVVVIGGGNAGFETAIQLTSYAKSVTLLNRSENFRADAITVEKVLENQKIKAIKNVELIEVTGEQFVSGISYKDKTTGEVTTLPVTGIFVEIGQIPNTNFVKGVVTLDQYEKIIVDPITQMTSLPAIWAAGDATNGLYHQNNIASGDAVKALENIYYYLHTK